MIAFLLSAFSQPVSTVMLQANNATFNIIVALFASSRHGCVRLRKTSEGLTERTVTLLTGGGALSLSVRAVWFAVCGAGAVPPHVRLL